MGFPYLAPLKDWVVKKLRWREEHINQTNLLKPFVVLTSGVIVTQKTNPKKIISGNSWPSPNDSKTYYGCIISNTLDVSKLYQTGNTILGHDLNGKPINIEGEENRRISTPIILNCEIDADGNNNTLKSAKLEIKVFSLKQLEMFELFFLRPGVNVVLEYGYNNDISKNSDKNTDIQTELFINKNYDDFEKKFLELFSHEENSYKQSREKYLSALERTDGNYDYMVGIVLDFSFSPDTDGTYNINLEINAGNELQLWPPLKQASPIGKIAKSSPTNFTPYQQWIQKMAYDLNLPKLINVFSDQKKWKNELFNWGVINKDAQDSEYSKDEYISMRMILEIINKSKVFNIKQKTIDALYYEDSSLTKPIMPVSSCKTIISTNPDIILPGNVPKIFVSQDKNKKDVIVMVEQTYNCPINGYYFNSQNVNSGETTIYKREGNSIVSTQIPEYTGNLLNVFIKWESFVDMFRNAYTQADIINGLLDLINESMFGLCKLELQKADDTPDNGPLTISDRKFKNLYKNIKDEDVYRFKIGVVKSIVQDFQFNMELSQLQQSMVMYQSELDAAKIKEKGNISNKMVAPEVEQYTSADFSWLPNPDNYFSVDKIRILLNQQAEAYNKKLNEDTNTSNYEDAETAEKKIEDLSKVLKENYIKFKPTPDSRNPDINHLIYTDPALVQSHIPKRIKGTTVLTPLEITVVLDGVAGFSCGEYFKIDGVPEIFNKYGYFQITNVKQTISEDGWKTSIEAMYLQVNSEDNVGEDEANTFKEIVVKPKQTPKTVAGTNVKPTTSPKPNQNILHVGLYNPVDNTYVSRPPIPKLQSEIDAANATNDRARLVEFAKKQALKPQAQLDGLNEFGRTLSEQKKIDDISRQLPETILKNP